MLTHSAADEKRAHKNKGSPPSIFGTAIITPDSNAWLNLLNKDVCEGIEFDWAMRKGMIGIK